MTVSAAAAPPAAVVRLRAVAAARPMLTDAAIALALYIVLTFGVTSTAELEHADGRLVGAALNVALVAPLAWRRRAPFVVLALVCAATVGSTATFGATGAEVATLAALFTFADREARADRRVVGFAIAALAAIVVALSLEPDRPIEQAGGLIAALTAAAAIGIATRARRAQLDALADRAARLEQARSQEAALAVAAERARIVRELHDVLAHNVSVMVALADGAQMTLQDAPDEAREAMGNVAATGREALVELRGLLGVLRDGERAAADLGPQPGIAQLEELLQRVRSAGLPARLRVEGEPVALGPVAQLTIYRIVQEALTNALRHAHGASGAEVHLRYRADVLELEVLDDGVASGETVEVGRGVAGMRERAGVHGARLDAGPRRTGGWRVATRVPLRTQDTTT
jgi:signal transduction histidine kinase